MPSSNRTRLHGPLIGMLLLSLGGVATAQSWTKGSYLTNAAKNCPPFVFVSLSKTANQSDRYVGFGTDAADNTDLDEPQLGSRGRELWFMDRILGAPVLLFPRSQLCNTLGIPFTTDGSVHEPCVYHHPGTNHYWVLFSYTTKCGWGFNDGPTGHDITKPWDIYAIDVTSAVQTPGSLTPAIADSLPIRKLTSAANSTTAATASAFNPTLTPQFGSDSGVNWWPNYNEHPEQNSGACVVDEEHGPVLYWVSTKRRTMGLGMRAGDLAVTAGNIQLLNEREIQVFGTTGVMSLFESPRGAGGSYRSSTDSLNQWSVFEFRSDEVQWQTMSGYANPINFADHNATTLAVSDNPENSLLAISRYYVGNNQSFGTIMIVPYNNAGRNFDDHLESIGQYGSYNLFTNVPEFQDLPNSPGKFAHPAGGRLQPDATQVASAANVELFLTYSSGLSHGQGLSAYDARLVAVNDVSTGIPASGVQDVLSSSTHHLFSMRPLLTNRQRFGFKHRTVQPLNATGGLSGLPSNLTFSPVAQVTAGPIHDTDVRAMVRRLNSNYYDPTTEDNNNSGSDHLLARISCLTKNEDPANLNQNVPGTNRKKVWGLRVFATDERVRRIYKPFSPDVKPMLPDDFVGPGYYPLFWGYMHHGGFGAEPWGRPVEFERFRHLGDIPADANGKVNFYLPAGVPVKFFLLHDDGTVLAAHRNHHSFGTGQLENRCTGCHQHVSSTPGPATSTSAPFDTLHNYYKYGWDVTGAPSFTTTPRPNTPASPNSPALGEVPEFRRDIWPLLQSECWSCHNSEEINLDPAYNGVAKFDMNMSTQVTVNGNVINLDREVAVWAWLCQNHLVNRVVGAAKSPLSWYFTGLNNDTDVRLDGEWNSTYKGTYSIGTYIYTIPTQPPHPYAKASKYWITTRVLNSQGQPVNPHPRTLVADRRKVYKVLEWIDSGAGIDQNPILTYNPSNPSLNVVEPSRGLNGDGYRIGLNARLETFTSNVLQVGWWDVDCNVTSVTATLRNIAIGSWNPAGNGEHGFTINSGSFTPSINEGDIVVVEAVDAKGNRSRLQKSMRQLWIEAETLRGKAHISLDAKSYPAGSQATLTVDAPSLPNMSYYFLWSESIHPGTNALGLGMDLLVLPETDSWFWYSYSLGMKGPLVNGHHQLTFTVPSVPGLQLFCVAGVMDSSNGHAAKSNIESFVVR